MYQDIMYRQHHQKKNNGMLPMMSLRITNAVPGLLIFYKPGIQTIEKSVYESHNMSHMQISMRISLKVYIVSDKREIMESTFKYKRMRFQQRSYL